MRKGHMRIEGGQWDMDYFKTPLGERFDQFRFHFKGPYEGTDSEFIRVLGDEVMDAGKTVEELLAMLTKNHFLSAPEIMVKLNSFFGKD